MTKRTISVTTSLPHPGQHDDAHLKRDRSERQRNIHFWLAMKWTLLAPPADHGGSDEARQLGAELLSDSHHLAARMPSAPARQVHEADLFERDESVIELTQSRVQIAPHLPVRQMHRAGRFLEHWARADEPQLADLSDTVNPQDYTISCKDPVISLARRRRAALG